MFGGSSNGAAIGPHNAMPVAQPVVPLIERVNVVENQAAHAHARLDQIGSGAKEDLRFLAGLLGVVLPSDRDLPQAIGSNSR